MLRLNNDISIIIPTLNAAGGLRELLSMLSNQSVQACEIIVIDSSSDDLTVEIAQQGGCKVEIISSEEFGHGKTRNRAVGLGHGEILVFMTQDALPVDEFFLEGITKPIITGQAAAAYARQIAYDDAPIYEKFTREYNYPPQGEIRSEDDIERLGIKAIFFSNAASAFSREKFYQHGAFNEKAVMNEDMLLCAKMLFAGEKIAYVSDAKVYHSHNYTLFQQFQRYFSIGMFMDQAGEFLKSIPTGPAGKDFAIQQLKYLIKQGQPIVTLRTAVEIFLKWFAVLLGKNSRFLPEFLAGKFDYNRSLQK